MAILFGGAKPFGHFCRVLRTFVRNYFELGPAFQKMMFKDLSIHISGGHFDQRAGLFVQFRWVLVGTFVRYCFNFGTEVYDISFEEKA